MIKSAVYFYRWPSIYLGGRSTMLDEYSLFSEWAEVWMKRNLVSVAYGRKIATQSQMQHLNEFIGNIPISKVKMMDLDE